MIYFVICYERHESYESYESYERHERWVKPSLVETDVCVWGTIDMSLSLILSPELLLLLDGDDGVDEGITLFGSRFKILHLVQEYANIDVFGNETIK